MVAGGLAVAYDRTFRYPFERRGIALAAVISLGFVALYWLTSSDVPRNLRVDGVREMALYALAMSAFAYLMARNRSRASVRVRASGLTVTGPRGARQEIPWDQIASIAPAPVGGFGAVTIRLCDGKSVFVEPGLERSDELCELIWGTGRFVLAGKPGWTRWVAKPPVPLPAQEGGTD